ncbi:MAG: alanine dehydrogenase [Candidatus Bathyarchaeota archaeon]|nr:alanine dehydrogenase [Candidatus Bathyarchaeota archaeon]
MRVLLLTEKEIEPLLSMSEVMEAVERAFREKGLGYVQMPPKLSIPFERYAGDVRTMPSYLERLDICAVKVVNSHPNNPTAFSLPTVMATITLIDPKSGAPLAVMGGNCITAMRTGAAGGVAAKYLARKDSKVVGIVGAGTQARTQLMALLTLYGELDEVRVFDISKSARERYVSDMRAVYGKKASIIHTGTCREAVEGADIVVTATPSRKPVVSGERISRGMHITCIGADAAGKQELDSTILKRAKIVVDDWEQSSHSGEINVALIKGIIKKEDIWGDICEIAAGLKTGRTSRGEVTVFTSTGLAVQDAVTAKLVYDKALSRGIGETIELM